MNPYSYERIEVNPFFHLKETTARWLRYAVHFPTAHPTTHPENSTVSGEYFQPRDTADAPLAILVHGIGDPSIIPCQLFAKALVKRGIACFVLHLVFHSTRMPEAIKSRVPDLTLDEWFEGYQISVTDVRQVIDWAESRPEIDRGKIAVIGISIGGFISAIAMGIDKRITAGVFLVAGGNSERIHREGRKQIGNRRHSSPEAEFQQAQKRYRQYLTEVAERGVENVPPAKKNYFIDPMTFASYLRDRPVLMLNASWDEYIPRQATVDFWEASGKPSIVWFPTTHATIWLWYPLIRRKITRFLESAFGM